MPLTDAQCRNAVCPPGKARERFADSGGLYLEVSPSGSRRWFWKYRHAGKEHRLALGSHPSVTLKAARLAREAAKHEKQLGHNPAQTRKVEKLKANVSSADTFKAMADEWFAKHSGSWSSHHAIRERRNLDKDLIPYIGERRTADVQPIELLAVVRRVEERGALDVAHRVLLTARSVWRYGVATARVQRDIAADLRGALIPHRGKHLGAITDPAKLGVLLRVIQTYQGGAIVRAALQLAPMLFQRPNELRAMAWAEVDLDKALWTIPSMRMKRRKAGKEHGDPHTVPLPSQAVEILRTLQPITGHGVLCFPGERSHDRPISDNTLRAALHTLGYASSVQTVHGFRATARTLLAEQLDFDPLIIEAQLAHAVKDANGAAYNRTQYLSRRIPMMQRYADYLDRLRDGAEVLQLRAAA